MNLKRYIWFILLFAAAACNQEDQKEVETKITSPLPPRIIEINDEGLIKKTPGKDGVYLPSSAAIGTPKIIPAKINNQTAKNPSVITAGLPIISKPGEDRFLPPKMILANASKKRADAPVMTMAKDPVVKDKNPYNFSYYGKLQGLKHNVVKCIIQDRTGNLWFGTDGGGVSKYDGKFFSHFSNNEELSGSVILSLFEDKKNNLWFGTEEKGVIKYDGKFFTRYDKNAGLINNSIRAICEDNQGNIWFGTAEGISKFDGKYFLNYSPEQGLLNNRITSFAIKNKDLWIGSEGGLTKFSGSVFYHYTDKQGLPTNIIRTLSIDQDGELWAGTESKGIIKFSGNKFFNFSVTEGLSDNHVRSIFTDKENNLWIATWGGGLNKFDHKSFYSFKEDEGLVPNIYSVFKDNSGVVWIGTLGNGIAKYRGEIFTHLTDKEGLSENIIWAITKDNKNNIWLGSFGGGATRYDGKSFYHYSVSQGLSGDIVRTIFNDSKGILWFGTGSGLTKFNDNKFTNYSMKQGLSDNTIRTIFQDSKGILWFGTMNGGVTRFDGKEFIHYSSKDGLVADNVISIFEDKKGRIWFGTDGAGISIFDKNKFIQFTKSEGLSGNIVRSIISDLNNNIWIGTNGGGITLLVEKKSNHKSVVLSDEYNLLTITEKDGLSSNFVFNLYFDKQKNLYIGTRFGLSIIDSETVLNIKLIKRMISNSASALIQNYTYEDGFLGIGVNGGKTIFQADDGKIWIAANERLTLFNSLHKKLKPVSPSVKITGIELFNQTIDWSGLAEHAKPESDNYSVSKDTNVILSNGVKLRNFSFTDISSWYGLPVNLNLHHTNNYITFNFIAIDLNNSNKIKYLYKLEGFDDNWSTLSSRNSAAYGNLPYGDYVFKVKALNSEGLWSEPQNYKFSIEPPLWFTWWFKLLVTILILLSLAGLIRWRFERLRMHQRNLENKIQEALREINRKNEDLKKTNTELQNTNLTLSKTLKNLEETQAQLLYAEKMASLGILTAGIAHEINNPLNYIQGGYVGLKDYLAGSDLKNNQDLLTLLNCIKNGVERTSEIVHGLNQFSRENSNLNEDCYIHNIIDNCLVMLNHKMKDRIQIEKKYCKKNMLIKGNVGKLHQVFLNIFTNAEQAIQDQGKIDIKTCISDYNIIIEVTDDGCGIDKENLPKVTDPFFTTKQAGAGTGLGLSIVYDIVHEHAGQIEFDSEIGKGTTVKITLPLVK